MKKFLILILSLSATTAFAAGPINYYDPLPPGSGGTPINAAGVSGSVQFNSGGLLTGDNTFTYNGAGGVSVSTINGVPISMTMVANGSYQIGVGALANITTGASNIAIGNSALNSVTTSGNMVAIGQQALWKYTGGEAVAVGYQAGREATSGHHVAVGYLALALNTMADNTSLGWSSMQRATSGTFNVAVGSQALQGTSNMATYNSVAVGKEGLARVTSATDNTCIGYRCGLAVTSGSNNTLLGSNAGNALTTGSGNLAIGGQVSLASNTASNQLNIANAIYGSLASSGTASVGGAVLLGINNASPIAALDVSGASILRGTISTTFGAATSRTLCVSPNGSVYVSPTC